MKLWRVASWGWQWSHVTTFAVGVRLWRPGFVVMALGFHVRAGSFY